MTILDYMQAGCLFVTALAIVAILAAWPKEDQR